ncbi:hypothetical protein [Microbacterium sp. B35-04]|nr:hypothetical protein [Microbacterium sp. B35-04]
MALHRGNTRDVAPWRVVAGRVPGQVAREPGQSELHWRGIRALGVG